jgi:hypothetical protein
MQHPPFPVPMQMKTVSGILDIEGDEDSTNHVLDAIDNYISSLTTRRHEYVWLDYWIQESIIESGHKQIMFSADIVERS